MTSLRDVELAREERLSNLERVRSVVVCTIKSVGGSTVPSNRSNAVWVSEYNQPESRSIVGNPTAINTEGVHVFVAPDPKSPYGRSIIGIYTDPASPNEEDLAAWGVAPHASSHQMPSEDNVGVDPVLIYQPAWQPLKTTGNGSDLTVSTNGCIYTYNQVRKEFGGTTTDLTTYLPSSGKARYVLLYLNPDEGLLAVEEGNEVVDSSSVTIPFPDIPEGTLPSAYVKLVDGQTDVTTADDVVDSRPAFGGSGTYIGEPYLASEVGQVLYSVDGATFTKELPLTNGHGWMVNDEGKLLVI